MIQLFKDCGKIVRTDYLWHRDGPRAGEPRGCGFIEFASREEAIAAKDAVNGKIVLNRPVRVRFVTEKVDFKRRRADESTIGERAVPPGSRCWAGLSGRLTFPVDRPQMTRAST